MGNSHWLIVLWSIKAKVVELAESFGELMLKVELELHNFWNGVGLVEEFIFKLLIEPRTDIKLNCIISSSDSLQVPVDVLIRLYAPDVVEIDHRKQVDKDHQAADGETLQLSVYHSFFRKNAWHLNEEVCLLSTSRVIS